VRELIDKLLATEAAQFIGLLTAIAGALVAYGLVSQAKADVWVSVLSVALPIILPLIQARLTRRQVYSKETTQAVVDRAAATGDTDIGKPPDASPPLPPEG
jgi:hypothetical protein